MSIRHHLRRSDSITAHQVFWPNATLTLLLAAAVVICRSSEPPLNPDTFGGWNNVCSIGADISAAGLISFPSERRSWRQSVGIGRKDA
jgi:hypothetical protein